MIIGEKIKQLRKAKGLTQTELAKKIGFHFTYISLVETGKQYPSFTLLLCLADFFNISLDELCCRNYREG